MMKPVIQRPRNQPNHALPGILAFLLFVACAALAAFYGTEPPAAVPPDAPAAEFSSGRAIEHVRRVGREPHPTGSPANARVREYIVGELEAFGLDPQVQKATVVDEEYGSPYTAAIVRNVLVRIEGTGRGAGGEGAVLLAAHYDTVPVSPGANDDGAGVATLLETARALSAGPTPRNDVILLFTDGEELAPLGAEAFVERHPWSDDADVALNFEAGGSKRSPSVMFETSANNERLISEFARAVRHPVASSATYEVYKYRPFYTDLTEFKEAGMASLNFAYWGDAIRYHTALDLPSSVDERTLQHHGSYALVLAQYFGDAAPAALRDLKPDAGGGNAVYFDVLGLFLIRYPAAWAVVFAVFAALLFGGVIVLGLRRGLLTLRGILAGSLASLLALVLVPAVVAAVLPVLRFLAGGRPADISEGDVYYSGIYALGLLAAILALTVTIYGFAGRRVGGRNLAVGALVPWLVFCLLSLPLAPGASFVFTWPLIFALLGLGASFLLAGGRHGSRASYLRATLLMISGVAAIALLAPLVYLLHLDLSVGYAALTALPIVLAAGLLVGPLALAGSRDARVPALAPVGLALAAAALFLAGSLLSGFDAEHPRPDDILYALDADTGEAAWATYKEGTDAYTSRFIGSDAGEDSLEDFLPLGGPALVDEAPPLPLVAPAVEVLDDTTGNNVRTLRLRVSSPRGAEELLLWLESDDPGDTDTPVLSAVVDGEPVEKAEEPGWGRWGLDLFAPPEDGIELTLDLKPEAPVRLRVVGLSDGLPDVSGVDETRPPDTMPRFADTTAVGKSFDLTESGSGSGRNRP